ncbi:MAG: molybdopterin molybdotransferase MoeA [Thermodesulfobacteriota bacterium]
MIEINSALKQILEQIPILGKERLNILSALGRILAEDIIAPRDIPPWPNSAMDGYAVKYADIKGASPDRPVTLSVIGDLPAGQIFKGAVGPKEAIRIMTGAPIPEGTDTVVPVEDTEKAIGAVKILRESAKGKNIRLVGEDVKQGEEILSSGTILQPAHIGMLASCQRAFVYVFQKARVAILSTGDELIEIDGSWTDGKIVNSNAYSLASQVKMCGAEAILLGIARDSMEDLYLKIQQGLRADIFLTSGGVSVGDYDLVKDLLRKIGQINFWKVAMRPGQPLAFGLVSGKPLFGLPGNPVSSMVSFEQFVRPAILKMMGHTKLFRPTILAELGEDLEKKAGLTHFLRCRLIRDNDKILATTTGEQGSGMLSSMVKAQGLIVLPPEVTKARAGQQVKVMLLDQTFFFDTAPKYLS